MKHKTTFSLLASLAFMWGGNVANAATSVLEVDSSNNTKNSEQYRRFQGLVYGFVWDDINGDGELGSREYSLDNVVVYIDANDNGIRDEHEIFTKTNSAGLYFFSQLPRGDYSIRQELPFGWRNVSGGEDASMIQPIDAGDQDLIVPKIIGGAETDPSEYPFMVALGQEFGGDFFQFCGGVLITDRWVVTAAHCSTNTDPSEVVVLAGTNYITDGSGRVVNIKGIDLHPQYRVSPPNPGDPFSVSAGYDIALWELETPVKLGENDLQTIAMLSAEDQNLALEETLATAVGWGVSNLESALLQDVHLPITNAQVCADAYPFSVNFETQICGGAPEGGIDACQGDSGGPLLVRDFYTEQWKLAGVTSYGQGCALQGFPGVWARVSVLSDWVKETALESSRVHRFTIGPRNRLHRASFGNQTTRFEPSQEIEPRWQLVNVDIENDTEASVTFNWRIIDEAPWQRSFDCEVDADGLGVLAPNYSSCFAGSNQTSFSQLEDGVYLPTMRARLDDTEFSRNDNGYIAGSPAEVSTVGELSVEDAVDQDFPGSIYYIDYFDLTDIVDERPVMIRVEPDNFDLFVVIYDADQRKANGSGGVIDFFSSETPGGSAEYIFLPDTNENYLIGVSSFAEEVQGSYTLTIVNQGTPVPTTIELPTEERLQRTYRKQPLNRIVVPVPGLK